MFAQLFEFPPGAIDAELVTDRKKGSGMSETAVTNAIDVSPLGGALGAEVHGLDLGNELTDQLRSTVQGLLQQHSVVAFRGQRSDIEQLVRITEWLGGFGNTPFLHSVEGKPGVVQVVAEADESSPINFGGGWHSDWSFQAEPPKYTVLMAKEIPPYGGDTIWSCQYKAYETLSQGLKETLDGLRVVHSAQRSYAPDSALDRTSTGRTMKISMSEDAYDEFVHPAVIVHPETGRRALFVNQVYSIRFDGWSAADSAPLLEHLYNHATSPSLTCRLRWSEDTITMWDNRCTQHNALNDYRGFRRELHRTTVAGTPLSGPAENG